MKQEGWGVKMRAALSVPLMQPPVLLARGLLARWEQA